MDTLFRAPEQPPICQCGCGLPLPIGSRRRFKNGHKEALLRVQDQPRVDQERDPAFEEIWPEEPWTYESAAAATPDDPEPGEIPDKPAAKVIKLPDVKPVLHLTKQQKQDIEAKIMFWLQLGSAMLSPLDDVCAPVFAQQVPSIAKAMLPLISQSPEVAAWFMKAGNFALWADLAMACWPVISVIIAHHITKTKSSERTEPNGFFYPNNERFTTDYAA